MPAAYANSCLAAPTKGYPLALPDSLRRPARFRLRNLRRSRGRRKLLGSQPRTFPQLPTTAFGVVLPVDDRTRRWPPEHAYPQFHSRRRDETEACVHCVRSRGCPWLLTAGKRKSGVYVRSCEVGFKLG